jgi:tetratricopeptide (TPR) repeat protein
MDSQPIDSALQTALDHKKTGNEFLTEALSAEGDSPKQADYFAKALREYHVSYLFLRSVDVSETKREGFDDLVNGFLEGKQKKTEQQAAEIKAVKVQVWNNMSLIYMRQKKYKKALDLSEDILGFDPKNEKALLKAIMASIELDEFEKAQEHISRLEALGVADASIVENFRHKLEAKRDAQSKTLKERLRNMFE